MRWTPIRIVDTLAPLAVALLVVALAGCESTLEVEVPAPEPQLVVNSFFTNDDQWIVEVSRSANAFGRDDLRERRFTISGAAVTVQSPEDEAPLTLAYTDTLTHEPFGGRQRPLDGVYTALDRAPDAVGPYTVRVEAGGFAPVEATGRIPPMVPASASSTARPVPDPFVDPPTVQQQRTITLRLHDPAGNDNYYQVQLVRVREPDAFDRGPATFETRDRSILDDAPADLEDEGQFTGTQAYFADPLFDGQTHEIDLVVEEFIDPEENADPPYPYFLLRLAVLSEDAYRYLASSRAVDAADENPFAEPVNLYSNVEGGFGIFAGRHARTFTIPSRVASEE